MRPNRRRKHCSHMVCVLDIARCFYHHKHIYNTVESKHSAYRKNYAGIYCNLLYDARFAFAFLRSVLHNGKSLNNNHKLTQENTILYMQQEQYNTLNKAIEETRHARHDMRHHLSILNSFVKRKDWAGLENYLSKMSKSIPSSELKLCENNAIDGVAGHYYHRYKDLEIPCVFKLELPKELSVSEIDICLVLSNLLENALEASMRTAPDKRRITVLARMHSDNVVLIKVENFYNGVVKEKNGIFESSKHSGEGIGTQSVRRIAEKGGGYCRFTQKDGIFTADVMLRGNSK